MTGSEPTAPALDVIGDQVGLTHAGGVFAYGQPLLQLPHQMLGGWGSERASASLGPQEEIERLQDLKIYTKLTSCS